jgi:molybdate transport system ATP-binding protein
MIFRCRDLHLHQGAFQFALDFEIEGQVIGIFGRSGAGKTTLLEIVAGLRKAESGLIAIDDRVLLDTARGIFLAPENRRVGYVPQDLALFPHLSVRSNLSYGYRPEKTSPELNLEKIAGVLEIDDLLDRAIARLSGGQRQRVAFARALLASPLVLLMDEPLASLDPELKETILPYLQRIRDEFRIPMLYVSHAPDEVAALCDQVAVLHEGKCIRVCPPTEIFEAASAMRLRPGVYGSSR